jgi:hypothetical protein
MNGLIKKKLNLLVHLARIDGDFHQTEKELILKLAGDEAAYKEAVATVTKTVDVDGIGDKEEIMYLALKLIQADSVITVEELKFCKSLASKLGFNEAIVDEYAHKELPQLADFVSKVSSR